MTKSQCKNEINRNNQLISQYQSQISTLEKEIEELKTSEDKVSNMKTTLSSCKKIGVARLSNTSKVKKINSKITVQIFSSMDNLFTGSEYKRVRNGLEKAIEKIQDEIYKKNREIQKLNGKITGCNNTISKMKSKIAEIEKKEKEEAEESSSS